MAKPVRPRQPARRKKSGGSFLLGVFFGLVLGLAISIPIVIFGSKVMLKMMERFPVIITLGGALYLSAVCVLPDIFYKTFNVPFYFGGTSLLIVIGVALDTVSQIESHLIQRHYGGFLKGASVKGRR